MPSDLQVFNFNGEQLDVQRKGDDVFVGIRRVCDSLGLAHQPQMAKLAEKPWATVTMIVTVGADGKQREMSMLHLDSLPMWLATIDTNRVAPEARPKLEAYQTRCAKVLRDYFFGPRHARRVAIPRPLTLADKVHAWATSITSPFAAAVEDVMVEAGIAPDLETAERMPTVSASVRRLMTKHGIEPLKLRRDEALAPLPTLKARVAAVATEGCTSDELVALLGMAPGKASQTQVGAAMKALGWSQTRRRVGDERVRRYFSREYLERN